MIKSVSSSNAVGKDAVVLLIFLILFYAFVLIKTAWLCDDAYITLRTVDNFINGHGLAWNMGERVQSFTHPLWMFILSIVYFFTHEAYFTTITVSLIVSLFAVTFFTFKVAKTPFMAVWGILVFTLSKAFSDYSSSGLENPLSYLLLCLYYFVFLVKPSSIKRLTWQSFLFALILLNRMDIALIALPALLISVWQLNDTPWRKRVLAGIVGFLPLILWEAFSLFYYGFLVPNTAFAKLNLGVSGWQLAGQGMKYLLNSAYVDPVTLTVILLAVVLPLVIRNNIKVYAISIGILVYLIYVVSIGGDFMSGRFLSVPLLAAVVALSQTAIDGMGVKAGLITLTVLLGIVSPFSPVYSSYDYPGELVHKWGQLGVSDERGFYYPTTGLLTLNQEIPRPSHPWVAEGKELKKLERNVSLRRNIGFYGYYAGPKTYIIDPYALSDPLLARLPMRPTELWLTGHYARVIPCGYVETVRSGNNVICSSSLATYYDRLDLITRGPLFDWQRLKTIIKMNIGGYDYLLNEYLQKDYLDGDGAEI